MRAARCVVAGALLAGFLLHDWTSAADLRGVLLLLAVITTLLLPELAQQAIKRRPRP